MTYLDMAHDILYIPENTLYCSIDCMLEEHPDVEPTNYREVDQKEFDRVHDENVESGNHWGSLCPSCQVEYHNF